MTKHELYVRLAEISKRSFQMDVHELTKAVDELLMQYEDEVYQAAQERVQRRLEKQFGKIRQKEMFDDGVPEEDES